nr:MFS transporter [Alphaproteobacteria bacterium]
SLALVPVAMTRSIAPVITRIERAPLRKLYEVSPLGVFGCAVYGLAMSAFWALAPVFFQKTGLGSDRIGYIMSVTILGGFLVQWPVGWVSDRVDRRSVITVMATLAALVAFALPFFAGVWTGLLILSLLFGAASFPIYSLTVAHVNDFIDRGEALAVSSSLLLVYGAGAIAGPIIGGILMDWIGAGGLYYYIAFMFAGIGAFAVFRMARSGPSPEETHEAFTPTLATTPQVLGLDPRSEPEIEPLAEAERSTG